MACRLKYKGKEYSFEEFATLMAEGELQARIEDGTISESWAKNSPFKLTERVDVMSTIGDEKATRKSINDYINGLEKKGKLTTNQAANLVKKLNNTNVNSEKAVQAFLDSIESVFSSVALAKTKQGIVSKLKSAASKAKGKSTIGQQAKALAKLNLSNVTDANLLAELESVAEELQRNAPNVSPEQINDIISRVEEANKKEAAEQRPLKDRIKDNTKKRVEAETLTQQISSEIERQSLIAEYLASEEDIPLELLQELEEGIGFEIQDKNITSLEIAKKAMGDVKRANNIIDKAEKSNKITAEKASELREGLKEATNQYKGEIDAQTEVEKVKYESNKRTAPIPTDPAERTAVEQLLSVQPVDDLAWYTKFNQVIESIKSGVIPYKEMTDLKIYSAYKSKAAETIASELSGKMLDKSADEITAQLGKKDTSQRERNILGIRTNNIWNNVYQPMLKAIKSAEKLADKLVKGYTEKVVAPSMFRFKKRKQFESDNAVVGIFMHYLQEQAAAGTTSTADGVPVGNRDIFGIILGNKKAMDAAGMDEKTQANFKDGQALTWYTNKEKKLLKEVYERLVDKELDYVDVANLSEDKLTKEEKVMFEEARKMLDETSSYQEAANLSRGKEFPRRINYFPTKRKGGSKSGVDKPISTFTVFSSLASAGKEKVTYSLDPQLGVFEFRLNRILLDHASDVALDYEFSLQQPAMNGLLTSIINKANRSSVAMALKNDYNQSLLWQASSANTDGISRFMNSALGARYAKSLLDPIRSKIEFISTILGAALRTRSAGAITSVFDKKSWNVLNKLEEQFGVELADFKDVELNRKSIREGLNEEVALVKFGRKVMTAPEYFSAIGLFMPTFEAKFKQLTGETFNKDAYLSDPAYKDAFAEEIKESLQAGQKFIERTQGSKVKAGTRRSVEYMPQGIKKLLGSDDAKFGMVSADSQAGRIIGFFGNYTYREQGEFFTSLKFAAKDIASGKMPSKEELSNVAGVMTTSITYGYLMGLYYIGQQLLFGDDDDKEKSLEDLEQYTDPTTILKSISSQIAFLGLSKYGKSARVATIGVLSALYKDIDDKETKETIEYILKEQFYIYKPLDFANGYTTSQFVLAEGMPAMSYLLTLSQGTFKDLDTLTKDPDAMVGLSLTVNLTNLILATSLGTQLPFTPQLKKALEK